MTDVQKSYFVFNDASISGGVGAGSSVFLDVDIQKIGFIRLFNFGSGFDFHDVHRLEELTILQGLEAEIDRNVRAVFTDSASAISNLKKSSTVKISECTSENCERFHRAVGSRETITFARLSREYLFMRLADRYASIARSTIRKGRKSYVSSSIRRVSVDLNLEQQLTELGVPDENATGVLSDLIREIGQ